MADKQTNRSPYHDVDCLINELERIQSKLENFQDALAQSHRLSTLGTIATIIAHEFNNILTPMVSYCQMAEQAPDDIALLRKAVSKSLSGAERAAKISSSLLGFAANHNQGDHCQVAFVVDEVLNCMAREPKKDGIELKLDFEQDCEVAVEPIALQQILLNLILNSRQAMKHHGGSMAITATHVNELIRIEVRDSGPGIPDDILPHIFEPFVTHRDKKDEKGTGLGLAICSQLVAQYDGRIHVKSEVGVGTTFTIELPAYQPTQTSAA